jgi:hypothetical protein
MAMKAIPITPAVLAFSLAASAAVASNTGPMAPHPPQKGGPIGGPDLVITTFGLSSWGVCKPGQTVFTFQVTVKNQGNQALNGQNALVLVRDLKTSPAQDWGAGDSEALYLSPGVTHVYTVPIKYYSANPGFMTSGAPHPFQAVVNPNHTVAETNYANNDGPGPAVWGGKHVIMVAAPKGCPK